MNIHSTLRLDVGHRTSDIATFVYYGGQWSTLDIATFVYCGEKVFCKRGVNEKSRSYIQLHYSRPVFWSATHCIRIQVDYQTYYLEIGHKSTATSMLLRSAVFNFLMETSTHLEQLQKSFLSFSSFSRWDKLNTLISKKNQYMRFSISFESSYAREFN